MYELSQFRPFGYTYLFVFNTTQWFCLRLSNVHVGQADAKCL